MWMARSCGEGRVVLESGRGGRRRRAVRRTSSGRYCCAVWMAKLCVHIPGWSVWVSENPSPLRIQPMCICGMVVSVGCDAVG